MKDLTPTAQWVTISVPTIVDPWGPSVFETTFQQLADCVEYIRVGGASGAPTDAQYLTLATNTILTDERTIAFASGQLTGSDGGAGNAYTIGLATTAVSPGSYAHASITVDAYGRITAASAGTAAPPTAQYVTLATDATLTGERVLTAGAGITITDGGAGSTVTIAADTSIDPAWIELGVGTDVHETPSSGTTLVTLVDLQDTVHVGDALRWTYGTVLGGAYGVHIGTTNLEGSHIGDSVNTIDGIDLFVTTDAQGCIYIDQVAGASSQTFVYRDAARTELLAHTATYTSTGSKTLIEDNSSGLSGTVEVAVWDESSSSTFQFLFYSVVASVDENSITVYTGVDLDYADIRRIWRADGAVKVAPITLNIPGAFAEADTSDALWNTSHVKAPWLGKRAHVATITATAYGVSGGTPPDVDFTINGLPVSGGVTLSATSGTWATAAAGQTVIRSAIWPGAEMDIDVDAPASPSSSDTDLTLAVLAVLE